MPGFILKFETEGPFNVLFVSGRMEISAVCVTVTALDFLFGDREPS